MLCGWVGDEGYGLTGNEMAGWGGTRARVRSGLEKGGKTSVSVLARCLV